MRITLIAHTVLHPCIKATDQWLRAPEYMLNGTDAEVLGEFLGRLCYDSYDKGRPSEDFHGNILEHRHGSLLAHASFTLLIEDVSRSFSAELLRHHVGCNPTERSTRYVDGTDLKFIAHPFDDTDAGDHFKFMEAVRAMYVATYNKTYNKLMQAGFGPFDAKKQARAAAARHLPLGIETAVGFSMNHRAFRNILEQRFNEHADEEIRQWAQASFEIVRPLAPNYYRDYALDGRNLTTTNRKV